VDFRGASAFSRRVLLDALRLAEGDVLRRPPEAVAHTLEMYYRLEGYLAARVDGFYEEDTSSLVLEVDEGRLGAVEIDGVSGPAADRARRALHLEPGQPLRENDIWDSLSRLQDESADALRPVGDPPYSVETTPSGVRLTLHVEKRPIRARLGPGGVRQVGRYNRVDGFAPGLRVDAAISDFSSYNHLRMLAFGSYGFSAKTFRYALGVAKPLGPRGGTTIGYDYHDLSDSDDGFRRYGLEEAPKGVLNTARGTDIYRRLGHEAFAYQKLGARAQVGMLFRSDGYTSLPVATIDPPPPPGDEDDNPPVSEGRMRSIIVVARWVSRGDLFGDKESETRALCQPSLYGSDYFHKPEGLRFEVSYELSRPGLGSDFEFTRFITRLRQHHDFGAHLAFEGRVLFGLTTGEVPAQKAFALGGLGTLLAYRKKEFVGGDMALVNLEWPIYPGGFWPAVIPFYEGGQVWRDALPESQGWKSGVGAGARWPPRLGRVFARVDGAWPLNTATGEQRKVRVNLRVQIPF
jgi:hypothetical protein